MSAPLGYGSRTNNQRDIQPVAIQSVNLDTRVAVVITRIKTTIQVDCSFSTGDTTVVPAVGEQWYVERFDGVWRLYGRIPFNDPTLTLEAKEGQVGVGSGRGPVVLHGQTGGVQVVGDLVLGDDHYRSQSGQFQRQLPDGSWVPVVPSFGADVLSTDISDSTAVGRAVLTAPNGAAVRSAIGAGDYTKPGTGIPVGDLSTAVQTSLTLANTALQVVGANNIFDASSLGRQLLTAVDTAAARSILNIGTGTSVAAEDIVNSTLVGRNVIKAVDQAAARAAIGASDGIIADGSLALTKLSAPVQASLGKADSAMQSIPDASIDLVKLSATGTRNVSTVLRGDNTWGAGSITSGACMNRTSTGTVGTSTGTRLIPASYFNNTLFNTADITPDTATGKFTVTVPGIYLVKVNYKRNITSFLSSQSINFAPVLYKNGTVYQWDSEWGYAYTDAGQPLIVNNSYSGSWIVQLAANDNVQAAYNTTSGSGGFLDGDTSGTRAWFSIALLSNG